jgi:Family of unknown function (DUF5906)
MGQFSVEKPVAPGSVLSGNQQRVAEIARKNTEEIERQKNTPPKGTAGAERAPRPTPDPDDDYGVPQPPEKAQPLPISDFVAYSPDHSYIYRPTGEEWASTAVNARVIPIDVGDEKPLAANMWLDRNDAVEQRVWAPGEPPIIENKLVAEGGFLPKRDARVFNLYKPPFIIPARSREVRLWRDHVHALWPDEASHIECWLAHRVQRPGEKINHALGLGGEQGVGKDAILEPLKRAVGAWNFHEISPQTALGSFNEFVQSAVLRISEGKDLGDIDRFAFYEATKTLIAAPPDTLRCNPKFVRPYYVLNVVGVIITTNHKVGGLFLPADDRRHFIAWTTVERSAFNEAYWTRYWAWLESGGASAVAHYLRTLDLGRFNPKAPPRQTQAFWEMVNAMRSEKESEMDDIIEHLGRPDALIIGSIIGRASTLNHYGFVEWLKDGKNARQTALFLEDCGYRRLSNPHDKQGRWRLGAQRTAVYVRKNLTDREGFAAIDMLKQEY